MRQRKSILILVALALPVFLFLWEQVQATQIGYQVSLTQGELKRSRERVAYLRLELEKLNAPESVAAAARRRLQMGPPLPESVVVLGALRLAPIYPPSIAAAARPTPDSIVPLPLLASAAR